MEKKYRVYLTIDGNPDGYVDVIALDRDDAQEQAIDKIEKNDQSAGDIHKIEFRGLTS